MKEGSNISGNSNRLNQNKLMDTADKINIIITGDFCPHKRVEQAFLKKEFENVFNGIDKIAEDCDLSITNLECPLTLSNIPIVKTGPNLKAHPDCINGIKFGGFNVVTLANNHIMDYGEQGLIDTINACNKTNIHFVGAGANIQEAEEPLYLKVRNKKIAIVNFCENEWSIAEKKKAGANPLNPIRNYYQIKEAKKKADIILLVIHGGHEYFPLPSPRMVKTYRFFADLGVTAIIGHHTHCVSGYEIYNDVPIFYSLGNFIFYSKNTKPDSWFEGYFIKLTIADNTVTNISLHPYHQCKNEPGLMLMNQEEESDFLNKIKEYSQIIGDSNLLDNSWSEFCASKKIEYLSNLLSLNKVQRQMLKRNILPNLIIEKKKLVSLLDMFTCEAHKDAMIKTIESEILKISKK